MKFRPALLTQRASICPDGGKGDALYTSFNYYFTENLRSLYNQQVPSAQQIPYMDLLIDYIGMNRSGQWHETIPLYQKAMLGAGTGGELCAGYYPLRQASLTITALDGTWDHKLDFSSAQINPQDGGPGLYLPSYHELWVGRGFHCLVLVQDQLVCLQPGPCRIPPLGSVVVLEENLSLYKTSFRWNVLLDGLPLPKENLEWLVGGFNLLVDKGKNFYPSPQQGVASLEREGWNGIQSSETQETQLDPFVPQPRSMLGKAVSGKVLLISLAGRTRSSKGATFTEAVRIAQYFIRRVGYL
ncbi:MAG: hypothetical protein U5P10_07465 [Spirochaetia bacterium]|nr:hypothetical protein [Spirochaetia bacterium]